ncbi:MAG TPA: ABC transporter ATP-binding protein [Puia sp.]|nr:ABC transporter ATP-binding protein [Puia sp.]
MQLLIERLSKTYSHGVRALHDVSLTLPNGMFGLLGPNGAGKSSLMRTIATLQEADSGSIRLEGGSPGAAGGEGSSLSRDAASLDVLHEKKRVRQLLGYLPQEFGVYPKVSAERMLDHIARLKGVADGRERKQLVGALLENVNLSKDRKKHLGTYSGGMKQRFGIAQALIGNPRLIIVDEPTAGLDPAERNRFYNLLSQLGENTIVILSTHIVEDVSTLCSNFAIICQGEVLYAGEPDRAVESLAGKIYTKAIGKEELASYQQRYKVISTQLKAGRLHIRVIRDGSRGETAGTVADAWLADGFEMAAPNLEDVYFSNIATRVDVNTI